MYSSISSMLLTKLIDFHPLFSSAPMLLFPQQAMLLFWHQVCQDCPENVRLIVTNQQVTKNIAFNYILLVI